MTLKQLGIALLCGTMIAGPALVTPALAQSTTAPAGLGTSPNGLVTTTVNPGGAQSTNTTVPAARGAIPVPGSAAMTTTNGAYSTGTRPGPAMPAATTAAMPAMSMTNINTASAAELDKLPQIGRARAAKIIKMRPYTSTDQLVSKKVLPMSVYNKIKTQITAS